MNNKRATGTFFMLLVMAVIVVGCSLAVKDRVGNTYEVPYQKEECTCVNIEPK